MKALLGPDGRLATGDPTHVPVGIYAKEALTMLGLWTRPRVPEANDGSGAANGLKLIVVTRLQRIEKSGRLFVQDGTTSAARANPPLIRLLARAHHFQLALLQRTMGGLAQLAEEADLSGNRMARLLRLSWLAPDITQAILRGQQPASLTADKLARMARLPMDWQAQRVALGFR